MAVIDPKWLIKEYLRKGYTEREAQAAATTQFRAVRAEIFCQVEKRLKRDKNADKKN